MKQELAKKMSRAFSLIEILIVLVLMTLIMTAVGVTLMNQLYSGQESVAKTQAYDISKALDIYRLRYGRYPTQTEGLEALVNPPKNGDPIMEELPEDPWNNKYQYRNPGTHNKNRPDVFSLGRDGTEGAANEIGNWNDKAE